MTTASKLVHDARTSAGLSRGALARNAGVPTSTVSRIEDGVMDPTLTMLRRVLAGASQRLVIESAHRTYDTEVTIDTLHHVS